MTTVIFITTFMAETMTLPMRKATQARAIATRTALIDAASSVIAASGHEALRIDEVVSRAGVAKGTFFAHFKDKDALMDLLIGARMNTFLDDLEAMRSPATAKQLAANLKALLAFMASERYVFDLIVRHSGAIAREEIGPIAATFGRLLDLLSRWLSSGKFRADVPPDILAEGVEAFVMQSLVMNFCSLNGKTAIDQRLTTYLQAWLAPRT